MCSFLNYSSCLHFPLLASQTNRFFACDTDGSAATENAESQRTFATANLTCPGHEFQLGIYCCPLLFSLSAHQQVKFFAYSSTWAWHQYPCNILKAPSSHNQQVTTHNQQATTNDPNRQSEKRTLSRKEHAYIIGDSTIKGLAGHKMSRSRFVTVHSLSGAEIEACKYHIKPFLAKKPKEINCFALWYK